uniref:helix-turn-helix domain-containing protein n=1 Tax=Actinomyces dentalis TaxID=272548 RepID=UPI002353B623
AHPQPAPRTDDLRRLRHERGLTPAQAAHHPDTHPVRISELERGTRPDTTLTAAYRQWLNTQQPQTHTA